MDYWCVVLILNFLKFQNKNFYNPIRYEFNNKISDKILKQ